MVAHGTTANISFGTRVRKSPFFEATRRWGCNTYTIYNHTYMPVEYDSPEREYFNLVNNVTLWDVACERQVEISGPDAFQMTRTLTPRNLSKLKVGQAKYVPVVAEDGGMINDPVLLRVARDKFWFSLADSDVLLWAKGVAHKNGFDVSICEPDVSPLQVQGPKSTRLMQDLVGDWILDLKYYCFKQTNIDGYPVIVSRTGWSNERGYEIFLIGSAGGDHIWEKIMQVGEPYEIAPGAPSQRKRMEAGILSYRNDMDLSNNPFEVGLGRFVDLDQDIDFIGKAALKRILADGITQKLVGLRMGGDPIPNNEERWPVTRDGNPAGELTSCVHSESLGCNLGYALTAIENAQAGTALKIQSPWGDSWTGEVAALPFTKNLARTPIEAQRR